MTRNVIVVGSLELKVYTDVVGSRLAHKANFSQKLSVLWLGSQLSDYFLGSYCTLIKKG